MEETHPPKKSRLDSQISISNSHINIPLTDRLSALPDSLLLDILSLLPLDAAIRTSVLSHRWTNLWTHLTHIRIDFSEFPNSDKSYTFHKFSTIVDNIVTKLASHKILTFYLDSPPISSAREALQFSSYLGSWVPLICNRNPEEMEVLVDQSAAPIVMPMCVFQCPCLVKLELDGQFFCNLLGSRNVNLPNVKELQLRFIDMEPESIGRVIKSCPLLEQLDLALDLVTQNEPVIQISALNLLYVNVEISGSCNDSKFVIDAPNLVGITLWGLPADYCFVSKLNALHSASIEIEGYGFGCMLKVFEAICNVGQLQLAENLSILNPLNHGHPSVFTKFSKLTNLSLNCGSLDGLNLNGTEPIPTCLLVKLEYMEMLELKAERDGYRLVKFVLRHANVLEKLLIKPCRGGGSFEANLSAECRFCKELFVLPTSSKSCVISFEGHIIYASSNDYDNESHHCKV